MSVLTLVPAHVIPLLASLAGVYAFTRLLTPEQYGLYALAVSLMLLFQATFFFWLELGCKRFFESATQRGSAATLSKSLYLGLVAASCVQAAVAVAFLRSGLIRSDLTAVLWIALGVGLLKQISALSKCFALASLARLRFTAMECAESALALVFGLVACRVMRVGAAGILIGMGSASLIVIAFDGPGLLRRLRGGGVNMALQRQLVAFAAPLTLSFFVESVLALADRLLIAWYLDDRAVGIYAVSYNLAERVVSAVFLATTLAAYPLLVRVHERHGREAAQRQARANAQLLLALAIPACGGFIVASGHLATVFIGAEYAPAAARIMPLVGVGVFLHCMRAHYVSHALHLAERTGLCLVASIPAALLNLALNVVLLPRMGLMGAVWATVIAYAAALVISVIQARHVFALPFPAADAAKAILATTVMCGALLILPVPKGVTGLVEMVAVGVGLYGGLALALDIGGVRGTGRRIAMRVRAAV